MPNIQGFTLNNGVVMPSVGLGVYQSSPEDTAQAVSTALKLGYRLIDTAAAYGNEREVGEGIRNSGVAREDVFVTTKLWISDYGYDQALHAFDRSMGKLGLDTLDLYLLHWPMPTNGTARWAHGRRRKSCWRTAARARSACATSRPPISTGWRPKPTSYPRSTRSNCTPSSPRRRCARRVSGSGS